MNDINKKIGKRIKTFREEAGINQQNLADILGVARPTISQIENGERKVTADELVKIAKIFNTSVETILELKKSPEVILVPELKKKKVKTDIRINVPQKNMMKFKEVFLYILNQVGSKTNVGETVIYKLLYFIDFNYYEKYEEQLIGASYMKNKYGPTPIEFKRIVENMIGQDIEKIKSDYFTYPQTKYLPLREPDLSLLSANEVKMIDTVLKKLSDMNATQISEYSHGDVPWLTTEEDSIIEYESVFYRTPQYSVKDDNDDIQKDN